MKTFLKILLALLVLLGGVKLYKSLTSEAEGPVVVMEEPAEEPVMDEVEVEVEEPAEEPVEEPAEPAEPEFVPLKWNGKKINKFAKDNGGSIVTVPIDGKATKCVKIGDAYYYKKGKLVFVYFKGKTIKLN